MAHVGGLLQTEERTIGLETRSFVPIGKNRPWVLKAVGGPTAAKGSLANSYRLEKLAGAKGDVTDEDAPMTPEKRSQPQQRVAEKQLHPMHQQQQQLM